MATQLEEAAQVGGSTHRAVTLTPQARRLLEGPVLATLLRLAAPTVALMLLQGVIAAGEAAFVGRLGSARPGRRVPEFPAGDADDHPVGRGLRRRCRVGRRAGAGCREVR